MNYPGEYDDVERFVLVAEQLTLCRELLDSGSPAKARMAIVLLDHTADIVMFHRCQFMFALWDQGGWWARRHFPYYGKEARRKVKRDFAFRLEVARKVDDFSEGNPDDPMLSDSDATVLQIGHEYRNLAYHRDKHNPRVVRLLAFLLLGVVSFAWHRASHRVRIQQGGVRERLDSLEIKGLGNDSSIDFRRDSQVVAEHVTAATKVSDKQTAAILASDLDERLDRVIELLRYLPDFPDRTVGQITHYDFWDRHDADEQLEEARRLQDLFGHIHGPEENPEQVETDREEGASLLYDRMRELRQSHGPVDVFGILDRATNAAGSMIDVLEEASGAPESEQILAEYQVADRELDRLEILAAKAVNHYDDWIHDQINGARIEKLDDAT